MKLKVRNLLGTGRGAEESKRNPVLRNLIAEALIVAIVAECTMKVRKLLMLTAVLMFVILGAAWSGNPVYALPGCPLGEDCVPEPPDPDPSPPGTAWKSPDLMVSEKSMEHTATEWLGSFTVSNVGGKVAGPFQVVLTEGTNTLQTYELLGLPPHQGHRLTFSRPYNPADCRWVNLTVTVDSHDAVAESNEDNSVDIFADPCPPPPPKPKDDHKVWRAQIRLVTGNVDDAGTDDSVRVELSSANGTWIDYGRDDFERNDDFTYDLGLDNITKLSDISMLRISKPGNDGWCLMSLELIINGQPIYSTSADTFYYGCWLDVVGIDRTTIKISDVALHAHPLWQNYQQPDLSPIIPRTEMESRIESIMGDKIYYNSLEWGGRAVEATRQDDQALHIDLDLEYPIDGLANPEVDVVFDLRFSCREGKIEINSENVKVKVDSPWWQEVLIPVIAEIIDYEVRRDIECAFEPITKSIDTGTSVCPTNITVWDSGNIEFTLP